MAGKRIFNYNKNSKEINDKQDEFFTDNSVEIEGDEENEEELIDIENDVLDDEEKDLEKTIQEFISSDDLDSSFMSSEESEQGYRCEKASENDVQKNCVEVTGITIESCTSIPAPINSIKTGVVAKIPVVLAEFTLQINVLANIELPEDAIEIKNIKKRLKITQCMLLQNTNVLFIKGFVRKNIDYSTRSHSNSEGVCGDIKHCTIDVPFECTTEVAFNGTLPAPVIPNTSFEFEYHRVEDLPNQFAEKDKLIEGDLSEYNQESIEYFNELPYCELVKSRIVEFDEYINRKTPENGIVPFEEKEFRKIEEKMVIYLTLKLLQNRQVLIPPQD